MASTFYFTAPASLPWTAAMAQNAQITLTNFARLMGSGTYTFEFWMAPAGNTGTAYSAQIGDGQDNRFSSHIPYDGTIFFDSGVISAPGAAGRLTLGGPAGFYSGFHHIVYQNDFENNFRRVYIDGILRASANVAPIPYVGDYGNGAPNSLYLTNQQGPMGEVRYWNYARTQQQIQDTMNASFSGGRPGLLGCWRCDERGPSGTVVLDRSGNNRHGIIS